MTDPDVLAGVVATLRQVVALLTAQLKAIETAQRDGANAKLLTVLEGLPFKLANSGKCDWIHHDKVPAEVLPLFNMKGEVITEKFHYRRMQDGNILRFKREGTKK